MIWVQKATPERLVFRELGDVSLVAAPPAPRPSRPVVAICGADSTSKSVISVMAQVRAAGGIPMFVGSFALRSAGGVQQGVANILSKCDAVMVMGNNNDIDPATYGQKAHPQTKVEEPVRAAFENELMVQCLQQGMPLMTICGGTQRLATLKDARLPEFSGDGQLHQHVPDLVGNDAHAQQEGGIPPFLTGQTLALRPGSRLAAISGMPEGAVVRENSFHHQAISVVPAPFIVSAVSQDGLVEAIEPAPGTALSKQFVLGAQWHPEFGASDLGPALMREIVAQGQAYAQANSRTHHPAEAEVETIRSSLPDFKKNVQFELSPATLNAPMPWAQRSTPTGINASGFGVAG